MARRSSRCGLLLVAILAAGACSDQGSEGDLQGRQGAPRTTESEVAPSSGAPSAPASSAAPAVEGLRVGDDSGPGPAPIDSFHPDHQPGPDGRRPPLPEPALGGRVIVHLESLPASLCYPIENSAVTRRILQELHESLLEQDWETWELKPVLCERWELEDVLVLEPAAAQRYPAARELERTLRREPGEPSSGAPRTERIHVLFGRAEETEGGWRLVPRSAANPLEGPLEVPAADVRERLRDSAVTFLLRDGVRWHDGHVFDARDVAFTWSLFENPAVDCDEQRFQFLKVAGVDEIDPRTVRFLFGEQYYLSLKIVGQMTILPSHLYDLSDPDNPDHRESFTPEEQARHVNENPHNREWVGLGPYRLSEFGQQSIEARRFEEYFDPAHAGWVDTIRWRLIADDNTAFQALLGGELDYFGRVKSEDYVGAATRTPEFTSRLYVGHFFLGIYGVIAWNLSRPQLADLRVRRALAHAFDFDEFKRTYFRGLANQVTGPFPFRSPGYDHGVVPLEHDLERAAGLLAEAGWYDRDGDGIADKDGVKLSIELSMPAGNVASRTMGLRFQENLRKIGVDLRLREFEWATFKQRYLDREFDAANLAWVPDLENDPEQAYHSRWAEPGLRSSNLSGLRDEQVDELIERGQREMDPARRAAIWRELHARIYELQPYLYNFNPPIKFAISRAVRGFQSFAIDPGYSIRRWYYPAGTPGTRPVPEGMTPPIWPRAGGGGAGN
jgi:peptide/nickel transport system substrate-binding protein